MVVTFTKQVDELIERKKEHEFGIDEQIKTLIQAGEGFIESLTYFDNLKDYNSQVRINLENEINRSTIKMKEAIK